MRIYSSYISDNFGDFFTKRSIYVISPVPGDKVFFRRTHQLIYLILPHSKLILHNFPHSPLILHNVALNVGDTSTRENSILST